MYSIHSVKDEKKNCFPSAKHDLILGGCVKCERCTFPTGVAHWKNFRKWQASISASPLTISNRQAGTLKTFPSRFIILSTSLQAKVAPSQKRKGGRNKFFIFLFRIKTEETTVLSTEDESRNALLKKEKNEMKGGKRRDVPFNSIIFS